MLPILNLLLALVTYSAPVSTNAAHTHNEYCAHDVASVHHFGQYPELLEDHIQLEKELKKAIENDQIGAYRSLYTLPVVVHVIHNNGPENISDAQVLQGIEELNAAFANSGYYDQNTGLDTDIQFCLAERDPDGNPTSGINRVSSSLTSLTLETQDVAMKDLSRWNPLEYINIWVVGEICSASVGCGVAGYAFFPASHGMPEDGLVVESNYFGSSPANSAVIAHEMGHYLGLYHTFQDGCGNNDCLSNGDRVCDTPPDQSTAPVPCGQDVNTCSTDVNAADPNNPFTTDQNDMYWNYMDYGDLDCYSAFTPGQVDRMYFFINNARTSLLTSEGCTEPCMNPLNVAFQASTITVTTGNTVSFTNISSNANAYEWQINGTTFANTTNTSYTFNQVGTYTITLIGANGSPFCESEYSIEITVECNTVADFSASADLIGVGESVVFNNSSINGISYSWSVNGNQEATSNNFSYTFTFGNIYEICLTAQGTYCDDTYCDYVIVTENIDECSGGSTFFKTIGNPGSAEKGYCIISSEDGNFYIAGSSDASSLLLKMSPSGEILWSRSFDLVINKQDQILDLKLDSDQRLIATGYGGTASLDRTGFAFKYDPVGNNFDWIQFQDHNSLNVSNFDINELSPGGNYIVTGQSANNSAPGQGCDAYLYELDRNTGLIANINDHYHIGSCETFQAVQLYEGDIFLTGRYNFAGGGTAQMRSCISRFDIQGNEIWTKAYIVNPSATARMYSQDILVENDEILVVQSGDKNGTNAANPEIFLTKTDLDGNLIWLKEISLPNNNAILFSEIASLPDGYALLGTNNTQNKLFIIKTNKDGEVIWSYNYGITIGANIGNPGAELILDNIYLYFLAWDGIPNSGNNNIIVGKLSFLDGQISGDCPEFEEETFEIIDYPNPHESSQSLFKYSSPIGAVTVSRSINPITLEVEDLCENQVADAVADISLSDCSQETFFLEVEICNEGDNPLPQFTPFSIYSGNPTLEDAPLIAVYGALPAEVPPGECTLVPITVPTSYQGEIFVVVNDDGSLNPPFDLEEDFPIGDPTECVFINNIASLSLPSSPPPLDLGPDIEMCDNGTVNLDAGAGYDSYEWSTLESTPSITVFDQGTYGVTVTIGCFTLTDEITVSIDPATVIDAGPDQVACPGEGVNISAIGEFDRYKWVPSDFLDCDTCQTVFSMPDTAVTYTVIGTNENGCISVDTVTINFGLINIVDTILLCFGESTIVFGEEVSGNGTYLDTVFNDTSCDTAFSITTFELDALSLSANTTPTCFEDSTGVIDLSISGGLAPYSIDWGDAASDSLVALNLPEGSYPINITDANGCELSSTIEIESVPDVSLLFDAFDISCFGEVDGMIEIVDASDGLIFSLDGGNFTSNTSFDSLGAGDYTLYYQDIFGCQYESYFSIVEPIEVIASIPEVDIIPLGDEVTLKVNTNAQGNVSYLWTPNDYLDCDTCVSVTLLPLFNGPLSVLVTDEDGCTATASVDLYVLKNRKVYIPNVFSPNDDGFNDRFTIYGSQEVDRIENLEIYDRWGEQIFVLKEFAPNDESVGWDGTFRGKPMNNAAFVYMVKIRFIDGEERVYKGDILLLR